MVRVAILAISFSFVSPVAKQKKRMDWRRRSAPFSSGLRMPDFAELYLDKLTDLIDESLRTDVNEGRSQGSSIDGLHHHMIVGLTLWGF